MPLYAGRGDAEVAEATTKDDFHRYPHECAADERTDGGSVGTDAADWPETKDEDIVQPDVENIAGETREHWGRRILQTLYDGA